MAIATKFTENNTLSIPPNLFPRRLRILVLQAPKLQSKLKYHSKLFPPKKVEFIYSIHTVSTFLTRLALNKLNIQLRHSSPTLGWAKYVAKNILPPNVAIRPS